jgi:RNA polymerase sigma-70 factor (ECF subfamily)
LQLTDANLIESACHGDVASFGKLYERYYSLAVGLARSRLFDLHLAEDAAQEAFVVACRELPKLRERDRFAQWFGTICRRTASRLAANQSNHESLFESAEVAAASRDQDLYLDVHGALMQLDELSREIVVLHYFSGLSHESIAAALEISSAAVHGRLQRARHKLAKLLDPTGTKS